MLVRLDLLGLVSDNTHELANERITPPEIIMIEIYYIILMI